MIFFLSSLQLKSFRLLQQIYDKFSNAELKAQVVPRSLKGTITKQPDLKGSQFKCLRGVDVSEIYRLLKEVNDTDMSLKEMSSECVSIKHLRKVQAAFVQGTNCNNWNEACEKYSKYATAEQLEPYKKLDFSGKTLPPMFLKFCQHAITENHEISLCNSDEQNDNCFFYST